MGPTTVIKRLVVPAAAMLLDSTMGVAAVDQGWFQWGTEGSYVHQVSHLLFLAALLFFIREMLQGGLVQQRGFRLIAWACGILALWNLDAVIGHALDWSLVNPVILGHGFTRRLLMENVHTWLYYLTKLDHALLLVPGIYLLYRGFKTLVQGSDSGGA